MKNDLRGRYSVKPGKKFNLQDRDPDDTAHVQDKNVALEIQERNTQKLADLHDLLYASQQHALLIILQGMDAAGKDGTIKHVMSGVNPQGCAVTSFKVPSVEEAAHDFLWRIHKAVPPKGYIGIFNRSQYEDVLVARVHNLVKPAVWKSRYDQINNFEELLVENNVVILKFFLHISKDEQKRRFDARQAEAEKNWKISDADERERRFWNDYQAAYQDAIVKCSTRFAPWYVVPANKKWFRNMAISQMIVDSLEELQMKYPAREPEPVLVASGAPVKRQVKASKKQAG